MGVKDGFMSASIMLKICFILLTIANLFNWIAFTTASWGWHDDKNVGGNEKGYGLWRQCSSTFAAGCSLLDGTRNDWYAAFQAFGIFGFVGINVAHLLVIFYMFGPPCKGNAEAKMACMIICFVAAVCWLIAVIIFGVEFDDETENDSTAEFGFSFALAIVGFVIAIVAGILLIVDGLGGGSTSPA